MKEWFLAVSAVLAAALAAAVPPDSQPNDRRLEMQRPHVGDEDAARIDEILSRLEKRSEGLTDIRCKVRFKVEDKINLSRQSKEGELWFQLAEPNPRFLIRFDRTETDGILGKREWYLFDGQWLFQVLERTRQVTKQQIARPGERIDLFDLETAPFPLPFGQKKETILQHFEVRLAPPAAGDPDHTDHLVCVPKEEGVMHGKYDRLEFFVLRDLHLPSRIVVTKSDGYEVSTAEFPGLSEQSTNTGLSEKHFARPSDWRGYKEVVEELVPVEPSGR